MEPRAQRLGLARTPALPVRRRSARYGAGGDIAAQGPYHKRMKKEEGRMQNGAAAAADASANVKGENVRLCSPMFAYVRLIGKKCLRPGVSIKNNANQIRPTPIQSDQIIQGMCNAGAKTGRRALRAATTESRNS